MKKILFLAFTLLAFANIIKAQEVDIKDDKVLLDGKPILKYEKINVIEHSFYSLTDDEEVISFHFKYNDTKQNMNDDYFIVNFPLQKLKVESTAISRIAAGMGMNSRKNMIKLIGWLLKDKVLNPDGTLNPEKVDTFFQKYNEDITKRTVRY